MKKIIHKFTETGEGKAKEGDHIFLNENYLTIAIYRGEESSATYKLLTYERIEEDWKPESNKVFYYIERDGEVWEGCFDWDEHGFMYKIGNCFPTKELAESKLKQIKDILKGVTQ